MYPPATTGAARASQVSTDTRRNRFRASTGMRGMYVMSGRPAQGSDWRGRLSVVDATFGWTASRPTISMMGMRRLIVPVVALALLVGLTGRANACPGCKDSVAEAGVIAPDGGPGGPTPALP